MAADSNSSDSTTAGSSALSPLGSVVLVVGLSGAGKSVAMDSLSDLGFFTVENLPVPLFKNFADFLNTSRKGFIRTGLSGERHSRAALSLDIDTRIKQEQLATILSALKASGETPRILFLDAKVETIVKRYGQTRRPHPGFDPQKDKTLEDAVTRERNRLFPLREISSLVIDTTELTVHDLRAEIKSFVGMFAAELTRPMRVNFLSFGFKHGVPIDCDFVVDVRFLPNPFFVEALKPKTGLDAEVAEFVFDSGAAQAFADRYLELMKFLLPQFVQAGKSYVNIGVGCTGGRHRSVAISEWMAGALAAALERAQFVVGVKHRDVEKPQ